jgi:alpha-tubulin suppressor-like RCC1 family protein
MVVKKNNSYEHAAGAAMAISAGWYHTCAVLTDGGLMCWGDGAYGQLGAGEIYIAYSPISVSLSSGSCLLIGWASWHD